MKLIYNWVLKLFRRKGERPRYPFTVLLVVLLWSCNNKPALVVPGVSIKAVGAKQKGEGYFINMRNYISFDTVVVRYFEPVDKEFTYVKASDSTWRLLD